MALPRIYKYRTFQNNQCCTWPEFRLLDFSSMLITILFYHPCCYMDFSAMTNFEDCMLNAEKQHQKCLVIKSNRCQRHKPYSCVRGNNDSHLNTKLFASHLCLSASVKDEHFFFKCLRNNIINLEKTSKLLLNFLCTVCSNPSEGLALSIS